MKIKVEIMEEMDESCCILQVPYLNEQVDKIVDYIKKLNTLHTEFIIGYDLEREKTIILKPEDIFMINVEDKKSYIYVSNNKYLSKKRLCELENLLGDSFLRISKRTLVNINALDNIEASFGGIFLLTLKNGCKEYISKKYLPEFKRYLGI